jgi:DNA repair photolyase
MKPGPGAQAPHGSNEMKNLIDRVDEKYLPVWEALPPEERGPVAAYFLSRRSRQAVLKPSRPRVIAWYCPFASQRDFPSGHRYCINVYTGCAHDCLYCYANSYQPSVARVKENFRRKMELDLEDLEEFGVRAAPVHLSNSTDPFQPLEEENGNTKFALEGILVHRNRFTTVTILTKNPLLPVKLGYAKLFQELKDLPDSHPRHGAFQKKELPAFQVEVTLAFWRDEARAAYDPHAPSVEERISGIRELAELGVPLVLRIDPLFPRSPLTEDSAKTLADFGLPEAQTLDDLESLVRFARDVGVRHVVYSAMKVVQPMRRKLSGPMKSFRMVYREMAAPGKPVFRGGSWRLPPDVAMRRVVAPYLEICSKHGVRAKHCRANLLETP